MSKDDYLTLNQLAEILDVHRATILRWIDQHKVAVIKKKDRQGHYIFTQADLKRLEEYSNSIIEVQ